MVLPKNCHCGHAKGSHKSTPVTRHKVYIETKKGRCLLPSCDCIKYEWRENEI